MNYLDKSEHSVCNQKSQKAKISFLQLLGGMNQGLTLNRDDVGKHVLLRLPS